jgi:DNA topoisomerase I
MDKNRFVPEDKGRLVTIFLEEFFGRYVEYDFTAALEEKLDLVSAGDLNWKVLLREFWKDFFPKTEEIGGLRTREVLDALDAALSPFLYPETADGSDPHICPRCASGRLGLKTSRNGPFVGCSNYPECRFTRGISAGNEGENPSDRILGTDPETDQPVYLKAGRFGAYVQLGDGEKPKRSSLPKGWSAPDMDLEKGLRLLRLPREVGLHPEDSQPILAGIGRYGPFVLHAGTYANLSGADEVFEVGLNRAVDLLAQKRAGARAGRGEATALAELGAHPEDGQPIRVLAGRYGPYIKHGATNANVPRGTEPTAVTLEQAVALIAERAAKGGGKGKRKPARAPKAAATDGAKAPAKKKPAKRKPAAKKASK